MSRGLAQELLSGVKIIYRDRSQLRWPAAIAIDPLNESGLKRPLERLTGKVGWLQPCPPGDHHLKKTLVVETLIDSPRILNPGAGFEEMANHGLTCKESYSGGSIMPPDAN